jgi:hypothetical protein
MHKFMNYEFKKKYFGVETDENGSELRCRDFER